MAKTVAPRTVRSRVLKRTEFRLVQKGTKFYGLANGKIICEGEDDGEVWGELIQGQSEATRRYYDIQGARNIFLHYYPNGFGSKAYVEDGERGYKVRAQSKLQQSVPVEKALTESGFSEAVMSVFNATDLLSLFEKMRIADLLKSKDGDAFIQAAARFAVGDNRTRALRDMEDALMSHGAAKWTSVTYLPFLWHADTHMFLKPEATTDFAERTAHRFKSTYSPALDIRVYESLLDLAKWTRDQITDLGPRDNIDVQSFIWVISGSYDGEEPRP